MKKIRLSRLAVLAVFIIVVLAVSTSAVEVVDSEYAMQYGTYDAANLANNAQSISGQVDQTWGENDTNDLAWSLDAENGVLTITGNSTSIVWKDGQQAGWNGSMTDYSMIPWCHYSHIIKTIIIEANISEIPQYMFGGSPNVETVVLPSSCVSLKTDAFVGCGKLRTLKTSDSSPDNVIDLRSITGECNFQVFESCFEDEVEIWLPKDTTATLFNLNNKFGLGTTKAHFVVYPGSAGEETVYKMINERGVGVYGEFTKSYYTKEQSEAWYNAYMATTTGIAYYDNAVAVTYNFDIATGKASIYNTNWFITLETEAWMAMVSTWKYSIKTIVITGNCKVTANYAGPGALINLPELEVFICDIPSTQNSLILLGNKKLTTIGTSANVVRGVVNLSGFSEFATWDSTNKILDYMFSGDSAITKVILPATPSITTIGTQAFYGCINLKTIVIPANCAITEVAGDAFGDLTEPVAIYNEMDNEDFANALKNVLPSGSKIYNKVASSGEGLSNVIVFDGWKVRTSGYNGLRGVFHADSEEIAAYEDNGWTLVEYGSILSTTANKNAIGAKVYYDVATNSVTADDHVIMFPIVSNASNIKSDPNDENDTGRELGKILKGSDVENENNIYFAVTVTNYSSHYVAEVYMAGYEIWKKGDEIVIMYTDYATDPNHDQRLQDASIYEVAMGMYMEGFMNDRIDKENIVWDVLVNGGALTLRKGDDYTVTSDKIEGEMKDLEGNAFGDSFTLVNVPQTKVTFNGSTLTEFIDNGTVMSVFNHPYNDTYVLVYGSNGNDSSVSYYPGWDDIPQYSQFASNWFADSRVTAVTAEKFPNPLFTRDVWRTISDVVIDTGVTQLNSFAFLGCSASTYVYSEDLTTFSGFTFETVSDVKTIYRAGYKVEEGTVDLHWLTSLNSEYTFDCASQIKEYWLPANAIPSTRFFNANHALTTVWFGGDYDEFGNPTNRNEGVIDFTGATAMTTLSDGLFGDCSNIATVRLSDNIASISDTAFDNITGLTIQQSTLVGEIYDYCQKNGYKYCDFDGNEYASVNLEESEGWSGIIVN